MDRLNELEDKLENESHKLGPGQLYEAIKETINTLQTLDDMKVTDGGVRMQMRKLTYKLHENLVVGDD